VKTRIVRIGNSRGVRIPRPLLEQAHLPEDVDLRVEDNRIIIAPAARPRTGWAEAARQLRSRADDQRLDPPAATRFDAEAWQWR
jgi:antitoxin MazE